MHHNRTNKKNNLHSYSIKRINSGIVLAVLSGLLLFLSFPKYGCGLIAWVAFIPLFLALKNASTIVQGLILGFITGIVSYVGIIYWIAYVIVNYGNLPLSVGIILMLLLACYLSIYLSLFAGCIVYFKDKIPLYFTAPVLWICFEYFKSVVFTGFPWENLGYSQYLNIHLIQIADITGVWGLSFLIVLVNVAIFEIINKKSTSKYISAVIIFLILTSVYMYGFCRIGQVKKMLQDVPGVNVSLIQGNIDQSVKWNENYQKETLNIYEKLSLKNLMKENSLIIWPETAAPFKFQDRNILHDHIVNLSLKTKSWLLFGSVSKNHQDYFNSAYLLSPAGEIAGRYDKVHLVPYGEYVPYRNIMPFVEGFTAGIGDFGRGAGFYPLTMDDKKIGILICYEGILPFAARDYKNNSAELLVNITNDAWFGSTSAPFQHFSMAIFRAVETRLYLVRAANTGISGIIDPAGIIMAKTDIFREDALQGYVKFVKIQTVYAKHGDVLVIICFVLMMSYFLVTLIWRKKCR